MVDKFTGHPKGYAYIEFGSEIAAQHAVLLSDSTLKDRQIKVVSKRKNIPGMSRGRGGGWRPRGAVPFRGRGRGGGSFRPTYRGRGGAARGYGRPY
ncbi:hypothetical protein ETH_00034020 [Eimeria tenella]|uniref:RRM domain-containing protein n=1 Tax=Eimeria tenella TaxID=5802 RepID=U6KRM7_EIMTE|nr:hypothetical protein ETH_00034020 [Eimeria tenella]CDJ39568.1 hypothetical protein ETH_00034020 [Eimeria tenella]|eukprot:XP_013230323.1 hypothetical protein ETH_00034020 [Eimeria tenella]